jgi:ASC-1-like (ASCH) protein
MCPRNMTDHVAFMKKNWGLIDKILSGQKVIESRWYLSRRVPWDRIKKGDTVYFKNSGESVSVKTEVKKVLQFSGLDAKNVKEILEKYGRQIGIENKDNVKFFKRFRDKKYCILIFLKNPQTIKSFLINKRGFGNMASWITVKNINEIREPVK